MSGATLGCFIKGCSLCYHYLCAADAGNNMLWVCLVNDKLFWPNEIIYVIATFLKVVTIILPQRVVLFSVVSVCVSVCQHDNS